MKKAFLILLFLLFGWLHYSKSKVLSEKSDIDHLEDVFASLDNNQYVQKNLYFFSNYRNENNNYRLYFMTLFALAPKVVDRVKFEEVPKDSIVLYVEEKRFKNRPHPNYILKNTDTLFHDENEHIKYLIFRKK